MCHNTVSIQWKFFHQRSLQPHARYCTSDKILTISVEETKDAVLCIRNFKRQLQNRIERFFKTKARGNEQARLAKLIQLLILADQVPLNPCETPGMINGHGSLIDKIIEHKLFELGESPGLIEINIQETHCLLCNDQWKTGNCFYTQ